MPRVMAAISHSLIGCRERALRRRRNPASNRPLIWNGSRKAQLSCLPASMPRDGSFKAAAFTVVVVVMVVEAAVAAVRVRVPAAKVQLASDGSPEQVRATGPEN